MEEAKLKAKEFRMSRLPKYLNHFNSTISANPTKSGWLVGDKVTYADLSLYQMVKGLTFAFPRAMDKIMQSGHYAHVFELVKAVASRERIATYLASGKQLPFGQGIFRHYEELDG